MVDLLLSPLPYITDTGRVPFFLSQPLLVYSLFGKKTRHGNVTSPSVGSGTPTAGTRYPAVRFFYCFFPRKGSATWEVPTVA